jgi:hypothetical protein
MTQGVETPKPLKSGTPFEAPSWIPKDRSSSDPSSSSTDSGKTIDARNLHLPDMSQPPTPLANDVAAKLSSLSKELNALPSEYSNVMSQISNLPENVQAVPVNPAVAGAPGEAQNVANAKALSASESAVTSDLQGTESLVKSALEAIGPAAKTAIKDMPYADILATSLLQKKNEMLYGTTPAATFKAADESSWSPTLKTIYSYIQGSGGGGAQVTGPTGIGGIGTIPNAGTLGGGGASPYGTAPLGSST